METGLIPSSGNLSSKVSWDKPEGTLGKIMAIVGGSALVFGFIKLLPVLTSIAWNLVSFTIAAFIGFCLLFMLTSKTFWNVVGTGYLIIMHKILYSLVQSDPISILNDYVYRLEKQIRNVDKAMSNFRGLIEKNRSRLKDTEKRLLDNISKKKALEKNGGDPNFISQIDQLIVMYEQTKASRKERLDTSVRWMEALEKVRDYAKFSVNTNKEKISIFKEQYEEAKEASSAAKSLKNAVNGDPDIANNFEMAISIMEKQMSENIGEVEDMLQATTGLLKEADLENAISSERANAILAKYDKGEGLFNEENWKSLPNNSGEREKVVIRLQEKTKPGGGTYFG